MQSSYLSFFLIRIIDFQRLFLKKKTNQALLVGLRRIVPVLFFSFFPVYLLFLIPCYTLFCAFNKSSLRPCLVREKKIYT